MSPTLSRFKKLLSLASLAIKRPREAYESAEMHLDVFREGRPNRVPEYRPVDWETALLRLKQFFSIDSEVAEEQPLRDIEGHVGRGLLAVGKNPPWDLAFAADLSLARCLYMICRALKPLVVVETGVAYGVTAAFMLKALEANGQGRLESIDLPPLAWRSERYVGMLVPDDLKHRWRFHRGSSQRQLPAILRNETVDLFVHDSEHTYQNMRREFETVWPRLRAGGVLVADDISGNAAFEEQLLANSVVFSLIVREGAKTESLFGIAVKGS